jgi:PEP-CTERM motif
MNTRRRFGVAVLAVAAVAPLLAGAGPVSAAPILSGQIVQISPPPSDVQGSDPTSNTTAFIWSERTNLTLASNIAVDMTTPGTANTGNGYLPSPGTVAAGTVVDTYLLHSDPVSGSQTYNFSVTFNSPILGIIDTISGLATTDAALGSPTTTYPGASTDRALEALDTLDWVSSDGLTAHFNTSTFVDEIRILVSATAPPPPTNPAVPEPSTFALLALGGGALAGWRRWRKRKAA